jgi:hypothetical protein
MLTCIAKDASGWHVEAGGESARPADEHRGGPNQRYEMGLVGGAPAGLQWAPCEYSRRGSLKLMYSLLDAGVVDEVRVLVCPASRGKGTRIFEKLVEATQFENGVVVLRYEIKK